MWVMLSRKGWDGSQPPLKSNVSLVHNQQIQEIMDITDKFEQYFIYSLANA